MTDPVTLLSAGTAAVGIAISVGANRIASRVRRDGSASELRVLAREFLATYAEYRAASLPLWTDANASQGVHQPGRRRSDDPVIVNCHRHLELARVQATIISSWEARPHQLGRVAAGAEWLVTCMFMQHLALTSPPGDATRSVRAELQHLVRSACRHISWRAEETRTLSSQCLDKIDDHDLLDGNRTAASVASDALDDAARDFTATISATLAQRARWRDPR